MKTDLSVYRCPHIQVATQKLSFQLNCFSPPPYLITCVTVLHSCLYKSPPPPASFQLIFQWEFFIHVCILCVFMEGCHLHVLLHHHLVPSSQHHTSNFQNCKILTLCCFKLNCFGNLLQQESESKTDLKWKESTFPGPSKFMGMNF